MLITKTARDNAAGMAFYRLGAEDEPLNEESDLSSLTRRSVIGASLGAVAAAGIARPYVARAAAKTATVWWVQGFAHEEDIAFKKLVDGYEKASGNTIEATVIPYAPGRQKIVAAVTSGEVPDLFQNNPSEIISLYAWEDKLVDVSDVVETQRQHYADTALSLVNCYNSVTKKRGIYGVPYTIDVFTNHIWRSLVEKAGYKIDDIPKTWDAFYDFFKGVQKKLREQGSRNVYALGFQLTTNGGDPNAFFDQWLIAYGGQGIVSPDGKLHLDDPQVRQAALKVLTYPTTAYKEGYVPPGAINWNDADDNNAFHAKTIVMDLDGSISTEVAIMANKEDYDDIVTWGLADGNDGKPVPSWAFSVCGLIPKGAKNVDVAKDFLKYLIQPEILNEYLKTGLGRRVPAMPSIVKNDPWWMADPHRKAYTTQTLLRPTVPVFWAFNPAYAHVQNEHVWQTAWADIMTGGMTPEAAADKAFKRIEDIFAKYPIA
jgi:multiple sugar transport system substrate-binding protein